MAIRQAMRQEEHNAIRDAIDSKYDTYTEERRTGSRATKRGGVAAGIGLVIIAVASTIGLPIKKESKKLQASSTDNPHIIGPATTVKPGTTPWTKLEDATRVAGGGC